MRALLEDVATSAVIDVVADGWGFDVDSTDQADQGRWVQALEGLMRCVVIRGRWAPLEKTHR